MQANNSYRLAVNSHEDRDHRVELGLHEATQLPAYRGKRVWLGYWRVLSSVCSGGRERGGRDGRREEERR